MELNELFEQARNAMKNGNRNEFAEILVTIIQSIPEEEFREMKIKHK